MNFPAGDSDMTGMIVFVMITAGKTFSLERNNQKLLKPSQLLKINKFTGVYSLVYTDTECYMAWIKGYLKYNDRCFEEVLEDISFWYGEDFE